MYFIHLTRAIGVNVDRERLSNADGIGKLDRAFFRNPGSNDILGEIAGRVSGRTVDLSRILARERAAAVAGQRASFMPKPLWNDNGSGLHLNLSLWKDGEPLFAGSGYGGLSQTAMHAMGGILAHAPALSAFCCPTTNSYKRLVAGFDAPVNLTYSYRNRSAAIRIPVHAVRPEDKRFEFRCPDSSANAYLAPAALLMAALDGIQNQIDPGPPLDKDLYDLQPEELGEVPRLPGSLTEALAALRDDHEFLLRGDVFTEDVIDTWMWYKTEHEVDAIRQRPHPFEFSLYYDV